MNNIRINAMDWNKYADAVGDVNLIHRFDGSAQKYGLRGKIAPGMYIASFVQGNEPISSVKSIKFFGSVYDGDELIVAESSKLGRGHDYVFVCGDDVVCEVRGVKFGSRSGSGKPLDNILHTYNTEISQNRINLYLESMESEDREKCLINIPGMFLASLSAPALLEYGSVNGFTGVHATQSFISYEPYKSGLVSFLIGDRKDKGPLSFFDMNAIQDDKIIASLRSAVIGREM